MARSSYDQLVDYYNHRYVERMELKQVIRADSLQRLNAILITALTSALGTLPLALAFGQAMSSSNPWRLWFSVG
jgi:Cu/Ag efflux pump CusA